MFGISMWEMILIFAIALIVIGPDKLPDLAKTVGRMMGELKKAVSDIKESINIEDEIDDVKKTINVIGLEEEKSEDKNSQNNNNNKKDI